MREVFTKAWRCMQRTAASFGSGIRSDVAARLPHYASDWRDGFAKGWKLRILAATTYIFFASFIPALAFGEQFVLETDGVISTVQVLAATAITGVMQAVLGGQPLMIVGVAEPIVLTYKYMFSFAKDKEGLGPELFLAWCAWVCLWAALMILLLAALNTCVYIHYFTRFSGELFGGLVAGLLFTQQAIKGTVQEFSKPEGQGTWSLVNGLWSLFLAWGLLLTSLLLRTARSWRFLRPGIRAFLADYGVPVMVVAWSGLSFAVSAPQGGVPARLALPNTWDVKTPWRTAADMHLVPGKYIAGALIPAVIIALLFFFDHNISALMAQQPEYNLRKPSSYHWDFFLLAFMTVLCGLIGVPPVNGVLPQCPMHTRSLSRVVGSKKQQERGSQAQADGGPAAAAGAAQAVQLAGMDSELKTVSSAPASMCGTPVLPPIPSTQQLMLGGSEADGSSTAADSPVCRGSPHLNAAPPLNAAVAVAAAAAAKEEADMVVELEVIEQRVSNFAQSLVIGICLGLTPALKQIPSAVLWGFFAYMSIDSLPGSQFWDRLLLLATDPAKRPLLLEKQHAPYLETVPFKTIALFTLLQLGCMLGVYGITWAGVAGILFPVPIMLLVPFRQYIMPRWFNPAHLRELDMLQSEVVDPLPHELAVVEAEQQGLAPPHHPHHGGSHDGLGPADKPSAAGTAGEEEEDMRLPEEESSGLRVVHHVSRSSVQRRRASIGLDDRWSSDGRSASAAGAISRSVSGFDNQPGNGARRRSIGVAPHDGPDSIV